MSLQTLVRVVVARSEIDMVEIKAAFFDKFNKSLGKMIKVSFSMCMETTDFICLQLMLLPVIVTFLYVLQDDCSGDYKRMLLALIGEE